MSSKLSFSIVAALALFTVAARPTHAAGLEADFAALEAGIPDSVDYASRVGDGAFPSNEEIEALESGNPDSVGYGHAEVRMPGDTSPVSFVAPEHALEAF